MQLEPIGKVKSLSLYPVKSMRGVSVSKATLYWYGLEGDRKYAFVQAKPRSSFPWLTARELPSLLHYQAQLLDPEKPLSSELCVVTPSGQTLAVDAPELRAELGLPESISLLKLARGTYDCMPVSILTTSQVAQLEQKLGRSIDPRRFRANILIDDADLDSAALLGSSFRFGTRETSAQVLTAYKTKRCQMINLDADKGQSDPKFLKEVAASFESCLGLYASVQTLGDVRVGDRVYKS